MTTQAPAKTHCPNCGAKLHRQDLSLCAYCATPLSLGGKIDRPDDETIRRLHRLREKPEFAAAAAEQPFDSEVVARIQRASSAGWALMLVGLGLIVLRKAFGPLAEPHPLLFAGAAACAVAAFLLLCGAALASRERKAALVRRPALILDRRSETGAKGGRAVTTYFFTMRFDDGSEGEFRWPGQGTANEPWPNGTTGVAYTRGQTLVEFRRL